MHIQNSLKPKNIFFHARAYDNLKIGIVLIMKLILFGQKIGEIWDVTFVFLTF